MSEYYQYGIPSEDWVNLNTEPINTAALVKLPPLELQAAVNKERESLADDRLKSDTTLGSIHQQDELIPTRDGSSISARVYRPDDHGRGERLPILVYFHGGGFLFGTLEAEGYTCRRIVSLARVILIHICYRHTPTYQSPTQTQDAWDGFEWVVSNAQRLGGNAGKIIVGGISAGANVAASVVLQENKNRPGKGRIAGQVLGIPWLIHTDVLAKRLETEQNCYTQNKDAPILNYDLLRLFTDLLNVQNITDDILFPGNAADADLVGMPPTVFLVAGMDMLRDEALDYESKLKAQNVDTRLHVFSGLPHGFYRYTELPASQKWFQDIADGLVWLSSTK